VQPIIGVIADQNKSRWGRRRPFIVMGSIIVAFSLLTLGFTKEIVGIFIPDEEKSRTLVIVLAVLSIYAVDFAINAGILSVAVAATNMANPLSPSHVLC
jgi:solute carrier family 45, member 1/2/4